MTGRDSTSTSSSPPVPSLPPPPCSSWWPSTGWTPRRGSCQGRVHHPRHLGRPGPPWTWPPAVGTAASPRRGTKTRPCSTGRRTSPASKSRSHRADLRQTPRGLLVFHAGDCLRCLTVKVRFYIPK